MVLSRKKLAEKKRVEKVLADQLLDNGNSGAPSTAEQNGKTQPDTNSENRAEKRKAKLALKKKQRKEALKEKKRKEEQTPESGIVSKEEEDKSQNEEEQKKQQGEEKKKEALKEKKRKKKQKTDSGNVHQEEQQQHQKQEKHQHHRQEESQHDSKNVSDVDELEMNLVSSEPKVSKENRQNAKKRKRNEKNSKTKGANGNVATNDNTNLEQQDSANDHDNTDAKTVYVGGIPYYCSEDDIRDFFRECGTICSVNCKAFPDSGKFRGIALLTFKTEEAAKRALGYDGANMGNQFLKVMPSTLKHKEAPKKEVHSEAPRKTEGYTRAYIGNLAWDITEENIRELFKDCKIDAIKFSMNKETGEFLGFGHVDFADDQSLEQAIKLDQELVLGRPIKVAYAVCKQKEQKQQVPSSGKKTKIKDKSCYTCGLKGHIAANCVNKVKET